MKVLILAGGFAKRLKPLTSDKAKPLLPLAGKPVISHLLDRIPAHLPLIVSTNSVFEPDFRAWRDTHPDRDITLFIEPAQDEKTKVGAMGAVGLAIREFKIDEDLLMLGGDNFFTFQVADFLAATNNRPSLAVFDIGDLDAAKRYGVVIADGGVVKSFQEKPEQPLSTLVGTCCYFFPRQTLPTVLQVADEMPDKLGGIFERFLADGTEAGVYAFAGYWNDIGSFRGYVDAHRHVGEGKLAIPDKFLDPALGNTFSGVNHIDESCEIRNSSITDSIVLAGSTILDSKLQTCIVDKNSQLKQVELAEQIIKQE